MIKYSIEERDPPPRKYPYLGVTGFGGHQLIVLFRLPKDGMVVAAGPGAGWSVGAYHENWAEGQFVTFHGDLTLSQNSE